MTRATTTPEGLIEATRKQRGVTKTHLARLIGMDKDNFTNALNGDPRRRLSDERRAKVARELGIPDAIIDSWKTERTSTSSNAA